MTRLIFAMRLQVLFVLLFLTAASLEAQNLKPFPEIDCETLKNEKILLPKSLEGKYALIGVAFSKKAEKDMKTWYNQIYRTFIYRPSKPELFSTAYDMNVFFVPMFTGVKKAAYGKVMKSANKKIDPRIRPHILFNKAEKSLKKTKKVLAINDTKTCTFFILNPKGQIIHQYEGAYKQRVFDKMEEHLEPAME